MILPASRAGKIAAGFLALVFVALNPPVVTAVTSTPSFAGFAPLYHWFVFWGVIGSVVLVWSAHENAFGLTESQVPPELERSEGTERGPDDGPRDRGGS